MYPEIFRGYHLYLKSLVLVSRKVPPPQEKFGLMTKIFKFNTSILLEKPLKVLPSH